MRKIMVVISIIVIALINYTSTEDLIIPKDSIRIRVVANSNNAYDQMVKTIVKNGIESEINHLLANATSVDEARKIVEANVILISNRIQEILDKNHYSSDYEVDYGYNYFPPKKYKGIVYEEGYYESLVITLGNGDGNNWWCILFPPLCAMEEDTNDLDKVEYKSFIKEVIDKYF